MPSNDYFDNSTEDALPKGATARAESVDAKFNAITTGLDKLPTQNEGNRGSRNYGVAGGAVNIYTLALSHVATAYANGQDIFLEIPAGLANTGAATLDVSGIGAAAIVTQDNEALITADLPVGAVVHLKYGATLSKWVVIGGPSLASKAAAAASAAAAATSESNAATSESNASTSASNASTSESNAATSETNAGTSETNAGTSETNAAASAAELNGYGAVASSTTPAFNLNGNQTQTILALTHNPTPTLSNKAAGRSITVLIVASGGNRTIAYNASWKKLGALPTTIPSGKALMLSFVSTSALDTGIYVTGVLQQ